MVFLTGSLIVGLYASAISVGLAILLMIERSSSDICSILYLRVLAICWLGMERDSMVSVCLTLMIARIGRFRMKAAITMRVSRIPSLKYSFLKMMKKIMVEAKIASRALLLKRQTARPLIVNSVNRIIFDFLLE